MNEVLLTIYNDNESGVNSSKHDAKEKAKQIVRGQIQEYSKKFHMSENKIKDLVLKMNPEGILNKVIVYEDGTKWSIKELIQEL